VAVDFCSPDLDHFFSSSKQLPPAWHRGAEPATTAKKVPKPKIDEGTLSSWRKERILQSRSLKAYISAIRQSESPKPRFCPKWESASNPIGHRAQKEIIKSGQESDLPLLRFAEGNAWSFQAISQGLNQRGHTANLREDGLSRRNRFSSTPLIPRGSGRPRGKYNLGRRIASRRRMNCPFASRTQRRGNCRDYCGPVGAKNCNPHRRRKQDDLNAPLSQKAVERRREKHGVRADKKGHRASLLQSHPEVAGPDPTRSAADA